MLFGTNSSKLKGRTTAPRSSHESLQESSLQAVPILSALPCLPPLETTRYALVANTPPPRAAALKPAKTFRYSDYRHSPPVV